MYIYMPGADWYREAMSTAFMTFVAIALIAGAIALLYLKWLGRGLPARVAPHAVPAAWLAMLGSAALWMTAYKPDFGLPFGFLIAMTLPLALIAWQAVRHIDDVSKPEKQRRERAAPEVPDHLGKRRALRVIARLISCLVLAPTIGMAVAMLAWEYMPGHPATRYAWAVFFFSVASATALVVALSAQRPWRALGLITASTAVVSAVVSGPLLIGALS
jgi:hypothetical protein